MKQQMEEKDRIIRMLQAQILKLEHSDEESSDREQEKEFCNAATQTERVSAIKTSSFFFLHVRSNIHWGYVWLLDSTGVSGTFDITIIAVGRERCPTSQVKDGCKFKLFTKMNI